MRPKNLLIYYGWLNSYNSADNGWDNENVAQSMSEIMSLFSVTVFKILTTGILLIRK